METLVTIMLVFAIAWGLFTAYVLIDGWQHLRRATKATEETLQQLRAQTATLSELKSEAHHTTLLLQAEYTRNRGLPEPDGEKIRVAFQGF